MKLDDLVSALLSYDTLTARQWVADAWRESISWSSVPPPQGLDAVGMAVAAGVVEMLAERTGQPFPTWTAKVPPARDPVFLVRFATSMPRLRALCEREGPEPLRRRQVMAPPDFLTFA